jgi:pseudoazurin
MRRIVTALVLSVAWALSYQVLGAEIEVKAFNRAAAEFFVFSPDLVRIAPGDTISFVAADKGHEVQSVPGMIPEGAESFDSKMSQDIKVVFTVPGVYVIACKPHMALGMVGLVVVGNPVNLDKIDPKIFPGKARIKLASLLETLKKN